MTQSLVSFIRKQLKVKGKSEHSGRGFWVCSVDVSYEELLKRVKDKAHEWSGPDQRGADYRRRCRASFQP